MIATSAIHVSIFLQILLHGQAYALSCSSRFYCVTPEFKYISMEEMPNAYLNATAIKEYKVKDVSNCQKYCLAENKCQSINLNTNNDKEYHCSLLDANKYSNFSLMVSDANSIHLYIPNACDKKPCKNGGVCIPSYSNDTYSCECRSNGVLVTRGKYCEEVLDGYKSAFVYFSFDDPTKKTPHTSSGMDMSPYAISWTSTSVPGRNSPVVACDGVGALCMQIWRSLPCLNTFENCKKTASYSIWLKYQKKQVGKRANLIRTASYEYPSLSFMSTADGYSFQCSLSLTKRWKVMNFGMSVEQTKWNQFTFTVDDNSGACAFINGVKQMCQLVPESVSLTYSPNKAVRIGGDWYSSSEPAFYIDDFAIWQIALNDEQVLDLFLKSK